MNRCGNLRKGDFMAFTDVRITVPEGMVMYLRPQDQRTEMERNALLLYPYINNRTISHGKAQIICNYGHMLMCRTSRWHFMITREMQELRRLLL